VAEWLRADSHLSGRTAVVTIEAGAAAPPAAVEVAARGEDTATVQYSSGSTGRPKGVRLSHRAILNNMRAMWNHLELRHSDISVNWIPLYHDMGLIDGFLLPLLGGLPTVLIPTMDFMRDPAMWLHAMHHYRGTISFAPTFAYALCAKRIPDRALAGVDLSSWRIAVVSAEPVVASAVRAFQQRFAAYGLPADAVRPFYGLAENVTAATGHPAGSAARIEVVDRSDLAGRNVARPIDGDGIACVGLGGPLPGCAVEIRDADGRALAERQVGTIWVRSDQLFSGYHRDPELTARILVRGWLNTTDRGYFADGELFFVARERDLLVVDAQKYAPHDIEEVINGVAGVREGCAVVFGVLNDTRGTEDVAAVVETKETDEHVLAALRDAIREAVTRSTGLALRYLVLVGPGGVEKTTSGKLARDATRQRYADRLTT
jgi:acyl-CoA synthetase (AMP-forming)/AMP-acid ligase II